MEKDEAKYKVRFLLQQEAPSSCPLSFSPVFGIHLAKLYLDSIASGKSDEQTISEMKSEFERAFHEGWKVLDEIIRESRE